MLCFEVTSIKRPITDTRIIETIPRKVKMFSMPKDVSICLMALTERAPTPKVKINFNPYAVERNLFGVNFATRVFSMGWVPSRKKKYNIPRTMRGKFAVFAIKNATGIITRCMQI